jgi:hypothetical protein
VTLWVLAKNHQARDFYARFGFELEGAEMPREAAAKGKRACAVESRLEHPAIGARVGVPWWARRFLHRIRASPVTLASPRAQAASASVSS